MTSWILLLVALVVIAIIASGLRRPSDRQVGAFARVYAVELTEQNTALIRTHIARMRAWRFGGAVAGWVVATVWALSTSGSLSGNQALLAIAAGFAAGVLGAELTRRSTPETSRAAAASPRGPEQYVARWLLVGLTAVALTVAAYLVHAAVVLTGEPTGSGADVAALGASRLIAASIAWIVLSGVTVVALRRVAQAPETAASPDVHAAHRAIRSSAMVTVLGAFWMGMSALGGRVIWPVVANDSGPMQWVNNVAYLAMTVGALGGFLICLNALPRTGGYVHVPEVPQPEERMA